MLYVAIFFIGLIIVIVTLRINVVIEVNKNGKDDNIVLSIFALRQLLKYKIEIPFLKTGFGGIRARILKMMGKKEKVVDEKVQFMKADSAIKNFKRFRESYKKNKELIFSLGIYAKRKFIIENFKLEIVIGIDEASHTAILTGMLWALVGNIFSLLNIFFTIHQKKVSVSPNFNEKRFIVHFTSIFSFRIVHIIVVGWKLLVYLVKAKLHTKIKTIGGDLSG